MTVKISGALLLDNVISGECIGVQVLPITIVVINEAVYFVMVTKFTSF